MLISEDKIPFPEECPDDCKLRGDFIENGQSSLCGRCPIFNCSGEHPLLRPEEYRKDWAVEWTKFFDASVDAPYLLLIPMTNEEDEVLGEE